MKTLKKLISTVAVIATTFASVSTNTFATGYVGGGNANAAINKPHLTMDKIVLTQSEAAGKTITVNLNVSGAHRAYASTGLHIYWDSRLTLANDSNGMPMVERGNALKWLGGLSTKDPTAAQYGMDGYFVCTAGSGNSGTDGVMWSFTFILPDNAKAGDVYPFDIIYKANPNAEDLFTNVTDDTDGKNMQAYAFTKGIYSSDNPTFTASSADIAKVPALANINKTYDGYIAISK
ncbi:MAG: hypothetical protein K2G63_02220 [Oscillospiraceae bacterium]|nr:hypothetical protein [Oscillospiraceae bacterium]